MTISAILLFVFSLSWLLLGEAGLRHYNVTDAVWDSEFSQGKWEYLGISARERARNAVISGVFALKHAPAGRILDVGCGEGVLADYLNVDQKKLYLGIDLSTAAINIAKKKRSAMNFMQADATAFPPPVGYTYDVIVFNEMLYYTDHSELIKKYSAKEYLSEKGIIVISVWYTHKSDYLMVSIFNDAEKILESVDSIEVSEGRHATGKSKSAIFFHIEAYRARA
jgi:2-polyprenyl-3-methyl-5-hydroxy-6-metoxy-1,4-benzoquinol methylase